MSGVVPTSSSFASASEIDLSTSAGVQQVLSVVRNTPMIRSEYNNLRDLIFKYKNSGGDGAAKEEILTLLRNTGVLNDTSASVAKTSSEPSQVDTNPEPVSKPADPVAVSEPTLPEVSKSADSFSPKSRLGKSRMRPAFGGSVTAPSTIDSVPAAEAVSVPISIPVTPPEPVVEASKPISALTEETPPLDTETVLEPVVAAVAPAPIPQPAIKVSQTAVASDFSAEPEIVSYASPLARIKEIKQAVNTKVGNPINLIDSNNEVGREYMNALLEAMKKVNGGTQVEVDASMERLEKAYAAVEETLKTQTVDVTPEEVTAEVTPAEPQLNKEPAPTPVVSPATPTEPVLQVSVPNPSVSQDVAPATTPVPEPEEMPNATPLTSMAETTTPVAVSQANPINEDVSEESPRKLNVTSVSAPEVEKVSAEATVPTPEPVNQPEANTPPAQAESTAPNDYQSAVIPGSVSTTPVASEAHDQVMALDSIEQTEVLSGNPLNADTAENSAVSEKGLPKSSLFAAPKTPEPVVELPKVEEDFAPTPEPGLQSVAKDKQLENIMHSNLRKDAAEAEAARQAEFAKMDPLMVPDVTNGLNQLLSEWSLFKSSGIFGTGPSGLDHPLFKKIGSINMSAVITGRFNGATPEVKQSITDYMNGWRYEEGIIHQHDETFEHYLRRVIRHILGKQNNKTRDNSVSAPETK